ncbi:hypothetical protein GF339_19430 [candidate division KSB3 bacterium]|uniref:PepSY domain-containing protein n=1 Tax=candidate division KSB3 bacterium TaxID=2044937 RepID=A0A9D5JZ95_9BACT|nr:hypothetical protein [candidate division KSB3 bacterium]MBD3326765.1 hypothetical protein [candidate division KSB3 bacterium]
MKKTVLTIVIAAVVITVGASAYAHYRGGYADQRGGWGMHAPRGGMMNTQQDPQGRMHGGRQGGMYGPAQKQGRGPGSGWAPCWTDQNWQGGPRWNTPNQPGTAQKSFELMPEEQIKEAADAYISQYLTGYTIDTIEKDSWRPMYFVTVKGPNDAVQQMAIHGLSGQVMHVYPLAPDTADSE